MRRSKQNPCAVDEADLAGEEEELFRAEAMRKQAASRPRLTGFCHNCDEPSSNRFCDAECQRDYERRKVVERKTRSKE